MLVHCIFVKVLYKLIKHFAFELSLQTKWPYMIVTSPNQSTGF